MNPIFPRYMYIIYGCMSIPISNYKLTNALIKKWHGPKVGSSQKKVKKTPFVLILVDPAIN